MAGPPPARAQTGPTRSGGGSRCALAATLGLVVVVGLAVLIVWLAVRPAAIEYSVEKAQIKNYNLTSSNALNATFDLGLRADNRNRRVSVYYDSFEVSVWYAGQMAALAEGSPFFQPRRNVTALEFRPEARAVPLTGSAARRLRRDRSGGEAEVEVRAEARVRFKVGVFKSRHRTMRVYCSPVLIDFSASRNFDRVYCDVDI